MTTPLTGSPKQVAWAETIRGEALASPLNQIEASPEREAAMVASHGELGRRVYLACVAARLEMETEGRASWWIDGRGAIRRYVLDAGARAQQAAATAQGA